MPFRNVAAFEDGLNRQITESNCALRVFVGTEFAAKHAREISHVLARTRLHSFQCDTLNPVPVLTFARKEIATNGQVIYYPSDVKF